MALVAAGTPLHAATLPAGFTEIPDANGLSNATAMQFAPDGRLFVAQQTGSLRVVKNGVVLPTPFVTLSVDSGGERVLLGLAFHPNFETNGRVFVSITDQNGDSVLLRYAMATPGADVMTPADKATCTVVLRVDQDFGNHNGGNIAFGPDGNLYFGLGDGGSGGDPCNRAQTDVIGVLVRSWGA